MLRRRVLAMVGALGLAVGLFGSGVVAQADTSAGAPLASSAGAGNGDTRCSSFEPSTGTCTINQLTLTEDHSAVCVEDNVPGGIESCVIVQESGAGFNNRAVVVQRYHENQGANPITCAPAQCATQTATIMQTALGDGSNFASVGQKADQKFEPNTSGDQNQQDSQDATITQTSDSGQNQADLDQSSKQNAKSNAAATQNQTSSEHGDITQNSSGLSKASANQDQDQRLAGNGQQTQSIDPRCCTTQMSNPNNVFTIKQNANQQAESLGASQDSSTLGNCDSSGHCTIDQTATQNGAHLTTHTSCTGTPCSSDITCFSGESGTNTCFSGGDAPVAARSTNAAVALRQSAGQAAWRSTIGVARSAPSAAVLT